MTFAPIPKERLQQLGIVDASGNPPAESNFIINNDSYKRNKTSTNNYVWMNSHNQNNSVLPPSNVPMAHNAMPSYPYPHTMYQTQIDPTQVYTNTRRFPGTVMSNTSYVPYTQGGVLNTVSNSYFASGSHSANIASSVSKPTH